MPALSLAIGNKNYSSWSLRPWLLLRQSGLEFEEVQLFFGSPDFDPGAPVFRLTSLGSADAFVVLLTSAGALALTP